LRSEVALSFGAFADIGLSRELWEAARPAIARRLRLAAAEERRREPEPG